MTKKLFSIFLLALTCIPTLESKAETALWLIEPVYSSITCMGNDFFKVKSGGRTGVFNKEGKEVVPAFADSITNFSEGCALVLKISDAKFRLTGILHEDGTLTTIPSEKEWYVGEYAFFSDGLLPVCTKKGKYGFIDAEGKEKIDFEYGSVRPFCEGLAAVSKGKNLVEQGLALLGSKKKSQMFYIEKNGVPLSLPAEVGTISIATSFRFGEALVINSEGKRFIIDNSGRLVRMESGSRPLVFNDKYVVVQEGEEEEVAHSPLKTSTNGPAIFSKNELYGYFLSEGQVVLPAQFTIAKPFYEGCAIAQSSTGYGVLKLENGTVACSLQKDSGGKTVTCTASLPISFSDASYDIECTDADGISLRMPANASNNGHSLKASFPSSKDSREYRLIMKGTHSELILWSETWPAKEDVKPSSEHKTKSGTRGKKGGNGKKPFKTKEKKKEGQFA